MLRIGRSLIIDFSNVEAVSLSDGVLRFFDQPPLEIDFTHAWDLKQELLRRVGEDVLQIGRGVFVRRQRIWSVRLGLKIVELDSGGSLDIESGFLPDVLRTMIRLRMAHLISREG